MSKKSLFLIGAAVLLILSSQASALDPNLVGWYKFDESSGSTAYDSSDYGINGTVYATDWAPTGGMFDGAVDLGVDNNDYVQAAATYLNRKRGTAMGWLKIEGTQTGTRYAFCHMYSGWNNRIQIYCDGGNNELDLGLGGSHTIATNVETLAADTWYHVALTWDSNNWVFYLNGVEDASGTYSGLNAIGSIYHIGNNGKSPFNEGWQGKLDDWQVWDVALSGPEIAEQARPEQASSPSPGNSATGVSITVDLSWTAGSGATSHNVYFGTTSPGTYRGNQTAATYDCGTMEYNKTYYWRIDEVNPAGTTTGTVWSFTTESQGGLDPNMVIWYKLDESSGTVADDSSSFNNDGQANGVTWMPTGGIFNGAISTPDSTDYVAFSTTDMSVSKGTVALNVRIIGTQSGTRYAFGHIYSGYNNRIQIYCDGGDNQLDIGLGDNHTVATNIQTLQSDCWYHLALTWNNGTYYAYVDGVQKATGSYSGLSALGTAMVGNLSAPSTYENWQGRLDDFRVYNRVLNQGEIAALVPDNNDANGVSAPGQASNPSPSNGATGVSTTADLSWTAGSGATSHNVYFGTTSPGTYRGNQTATTYDCGTMPAGPVHYWRIDEVNAGGTTTGNVWNFTTAAGTPPGKATNPSPANSATGVSTTADLSWTAGSGATSHNVYFGTTSPGTFRGNQTATTYDCGTMTYGKLYYWRIDEVNGSGTTTGDVWAFFVGNLPAFPGAEGFGAKATGGRGGAVIKVTNLNTSGAGSLAAACATSGARIIVFDVSGVIPGQVNITQSNVTIAGQTAPGAGITIQGMLKSYGYTINNAIVRHLRMRPNQPAPGGQTDCVQMGGEGTHTMIFDHISAAWGNDENFDVYNANNVTLQWSTIEESDPCNHPKGKHNFGMIAAATGSGWISVHNNLFTHHYRRVPCIAQYSGNAEYINNIAYNASCGYAHEGHGPNITGDLNLYNNYYARGPNCMSRIYPYALEPTVDYYVEDVYFENWGYQDHPCEWIPSWLPGGGPTWIQYNSAGKRIYSPAACSNYPVTVTTALQAYTNVIAKAGCWPRDRITTQNAADVNAHTGAQRRSGPANPATSWFMYGLTPGSPPTDTDGDGMPDSWETAKGLNPNNAGDRNNIVPNGASPNNRHMGYTYIEYYINELADNLVP